MNGADNENNKDCRLCLILGQCAFCCAILPSCSTPPTPHPPNKKKKIIYIYIIILFFKVCSVYLRLMNHVNVGLRCCESIWQKKKKKKKAACSFYLNIKLAFDVRSCEAIPQKLFILLEVKGLPSQIWHNLKIKSYRLSAAFLLLLLVVVVVFFFFFFFFFSSTKLFRHLA